MRTIPNRMMTTPVDAPRTRRNHDLRVFTSLKAGKFTPVAVIPLLREDSATVNVNLSFQHEETVDVLMNGINIDVRAHLVPNMAYERFLSYDDLNRAYKKVPRELGGDIIPYFEYAAAGAYGTNEIHDALGKHALPTDLINLQYVEAVNTAWNHMAKNISPNITLRDRHDKTLPPAFWSHNMYSYMVADFDQAVMQGEVALQIAEQNLAIKGSITDRYVPVSSPGTQMQANVGGTNYNIATTAGGAQLQAVGAPPNTGVINMTGLRADLQGAVAELTQGGIKISLANIDLARKTQVWANIRKRYNQLPEMFLVELLMDGIPVPEQAWLQPIQLAHEHTIFGQAKRYASDGASLTESVVNGAAGVQLSFATPKVPCGGVIVITAEISPEQIFERQRDPYLHIGDHFSLPQFMPDDADPEKVEVVTNKCIDITHSAPDDTFAYAPLNWEWNSVPPQIGGRYIQRTPDAPFNSARNPIWAVEEVDPTFGETAYLVTNMHLKPFYDSNIDPFTVLSRGNAAITGLTVFGPQLIEATAVSDYDEVLARIDQELIDKDA